MQYIYSGIGWAVNQCEFKHRVPRAYRITVACCGTLAVTIRKNDNCLQSQSVVECKHRRKCHLEYPAYYISQSLSQHCTFSEESQSVFDICIHTRLSSGTHSPGIFRGCHGERWKRASSSVSWSRTERPRDRPTAGEVSLGRGFICKLIEMARAYMERNALAQAPADCAHTTRCRRP